MVIILKDTITGTDQNEKITWYNANVWRQDLTVNAKGGNDTINFKKSQYKNKLNGQNGNDVIYGGTSADMIRGGAGTDKLYGYNGKDSLYGDAGKDTIYGGYGDDYLNGGNDNDLLYGEQGTDELYGGDGNDTLYCGDGIDYANGGNGDDYIEGGAGFGRLFGLAGNDTIYGGKDKDTIDGGVGDDLLYGNGDSDTVKGNTGNDTLYGGDGNDYLYGMADNDLLYGGEGNDLLDGSDGDDSLIGEAGNDTVRSGAGDDYVEGGDGDDQIVGHGGNDTLLGDDGDDFIDGGNGDDSIEGGVGNDLIRGGSGNDYIDGGDGDDNIQGQTGDNTIYGGFGNDTIYVGKGNEIIDAGDGANEIYFSANSGNATLSSGGGNDTLILSNVSTDDINENRVQFTKSDDGTSLVININDSQTVNIQGYYESEHSVNMIKLSDKEEAEDIDNFVSDTITGSGLIEGTNANDYIIGSDENDTIISKKGIDTIESGTGSDVIKINELSGKKYLVDVNSDDKLQYLYYDNVGHSFEKDNNDLIITQILDETDDENSQKVVINDFFTQENPIDTFELVTDNEEILTSLSILNDAVINVIGVDATETPYQGTDYNEYITGSGTIYANGGNDHIETGDSNDIIYAGVGNDTINAGGGDNQIYFDENCGNAYIQSGGGTDTLVLSNVSSADIDENRVQFTKSDDGANLIININDSQTVNIQGFYTTEHSVKLIKLSDKDEAEDINNYINDPIVPGIIEGTEGDDSLEGTDGDDTIIPYSGTDTIITGAGNDVVKIVELNGTKYLNDVNSNDKIQYLYREGVGHGFYNENNHLLITQGVDDNFHIIDIADFFTQENPLDTIELVNEDSEVVSTISILNDAQIRAEEIDATETPYQGTDYNEYITGSGTIYANGGNDYIETGDNNDIIYAGVGNDTINAGGGDNQIYFDENCDNLTIENGWGNDTLVLTNVSSQDIDENRVQFTQSDDKTSLIININDTQTINIQGFYSSEHSVKLIKLSDKEEAEDINDYLNGVIEPISGTGLIEGTNGADSIVGSDENDTIIPYDGRDTIVSGAGNDVVKIVELNGKKYLNDVNSDDKIQYLYHESAGRGFYNENNHLLITQGVDDNFHIIDIADFFTQENPLDTIELVNEDSEVVSTISILNDAQIRAEEIDATETPYQGTKYSEYITGSGIIYGNDGNDYIEAIDGNDEIHGGIGNDSLFGGIGNDIIYGDDGNDYLSTYSFDATTKDTIEGVTDTIYGGAGDDVLLGQSETNYLYGGDDNDTYIAYSDQHTIVADSNGDAELVYINNESYTDLHFVFNVDNAGNVDNNGLWVLNNENFAKWQANITDNTIVGVNIVANDEIDGSSWDSVETFRDTGDDSGYYTLSVAAVQTVKGDIASWLAENEYADVADVFANEKTDGDINTLIAKYNVTDNWTYHAYEP